MRSLDAGDLERVGRFVAETGEIEGDEPFPAEFLAALRLLVSCDSVTFCELDRVGKRALGTVAYPDEPEEDDGLALDYWTARREHPICHYHETTGDWRAYRLSDFVEMRRFRSSRIYAEWFRPQHVESLITVGLDSPLSHTKVFLLARSDGRDFDAADCLVLDVLRPYLAMRYEAARSAAQGNLTSGVLTCRETPGPGARRGREDERGDCRRALHRPRHGTPAPREHLCEARRAYAYRGRPRRRARLRPQRRSRLTFLRCAPACRIDAGL